jgi:hypothetical protein
VNVTQKNNNLSRDGLYIDAAFTPGNAVNLTRDMNFNGTISGNMYAQPLHIEGGSNGPRVIAVTESNNVLDPNDGSLIWQRNLGPAVTSGLPCGNINPLGITGTPAVDLASRSLFVDAMIDGATKKHFVYLPNVDPGVTNPNWSVDLNSSVPVFTSNVQNERARLANVNGIIYVPFSGHAGDCGTYRGWFVGIPINNPSAVMAWATSAILGGMGASPATGLTCLWSRATHSTPEATGWVGKQSFVYKKARFLAATLPTTGRQSISSISTTSI